MRHGGTALRILTGLTGMVLAGSMAAPFIWMIATALRPPGELFEGSSGWIPSELRFGNFVDVWRELAPGRYFLNSLVTSTAAAVIQVGVALLLAYAFVRIRVPGRSILFGAILVTMFIPEELRLIPNYVLAGKLGWIDSYWALIFPPAAHAFPVLVLTVQLQTVPRDYFDAAAMDGASHWRALRDVAAPASSTILVALFLIAFLGRWNDYLWPLVVTDSEQMRTIPVALAWYRGTQESGVNWTGLMALASLSVAPLIALFVIVQNRFTEGLLTGGAKG